MPHRKKKKDAFTAWRRPVRKSRPPLPPDDLAVCRSPFYGFNEALIASWCEVSIETVVSWKDGRAQPTAAEMKLFLLYSREQVLDQLWWAGWIVRKKILVDPDGNECSHSLLRAYPMIVQLCRRLAYENASKEVVQLFEQLLKVS